MSREGEGEDEEAKIQKALDCPCLDEVRNGACGTPFLEAFSCFLRSKEEEKVRTSQPWGRPSSSVSTYHL